jgi:hypothetical protein
VTPLQARAQAKWRARMTRDGLALEFGAGLARTRRLGVQHPGGKMAPDAVRFGRAYKLGVCFGYCWSLIYLITSKIILLGMDFRLECLVGKTRQGRTTWWPSDDAACAAQHQHGMNTHAGINALTSHPNMHFWTLNMCTVQRLFVRLSNPNMPSVSFPKKKICPPKNKGGSTI